VTPGIAICSMGNCTPESQFRMPRRQFSAGHRSVISRAASWGSAVWHQIAVKQAEMSSRSREVSVGVKGGGAGVVVLVLAIEALLFGTGRAIG